MASPPEECTCAIPPSFALNKATFGTTTGQQRLSAFRSSCFTGVGQHASTAPGAMSSIFVTPLRGRSFVSKFIIITMRLVTICHLRCVGMSTGSGPPRPWTVAWSRPTEIPPPALRKACLPLAAGKQVFVVVVITSPQCGQQFSIEVNACYRETETNNTPGTAGRLYLPGEWDDQFRLRFDYFALGAFRRISGICDDRGNAANTPDFDLRITTATNTHRI